MSKILCLLLAIASLSGCASYSETFDCGAGPGVGCKSLTYVNDMVEKGRLPLNEGLEPTGFTNLDVQKSQGFRVWMAAYVDENGHMHEPSYVRLEQ